MKKKIIWISIIVILLVAVVGLKIKAGSAPMDVELGAVQKGSIDKFVEETAVVKLKDENSVFASGSGRVAEILYNVGDQVKAGDIIVRLDDSELQLEKKALEAQKKSKAAQFAELKNPNNSEEVNKLGILVKSAETAYQKAKREADNNKSLLDAGALSYESYQESLTKLNTAEASLETAKSDLALANKGISGNVKVQYEAQISEIQTQIDILNNKINEMLVRAPFEGIILAKDVEAGSTVQSGTLLMRLGSSNGMHLESDILADEIAEVNLGDTVLISNEDLGIKDIKGTVAKIYPAAFSKTSELGIEQKRVKVEINIGENIPGLKSGYDMNIRIITDSKNNTIIVSDKAVFEYQGKDHVFVNENGVAKLRKIEKGIESDNKVEVLKGLKEGEQVVLTPDEKLSEGKKIK